MKALPTLTRRAALFVALAGPAAAAALNACSSSGSSPDAPPPDGAAGTEGDDGGGAGRDAAGGQGPGGPGGPPLPFEAVSPYAYAAKVKTLLTGLAPTDDEVAAVAADPAALRGLVDGWTARPEFRAKMMTFFSNAFQQAQLNGASLSEQFGGRTLRGDGLEPLLRNVSESFGRTALALVDEGRPLTEAVTTRRFMLTPALLSFLAYFDADHIDDGGGRGGSERTSFTVVLDGTTVIPAAQSADPASPNFMRWAPGGPAFAGGPACQARQGKAPFELFAYLLGVAPGGGGCAAAGFPAPVAGDDFTAWRMVTLRQRGPDEAAPPFYDLAALRRADEFALRVPRVGFFSTPGFFANWPSNDSNQLRVTTNQALIVALGQSFDGADSTVPLSQAGLDGEHAAPGTECYGCHQALDPMRQFFARAYTYSYHDQRDPQKRALEGNFAFDGVTAAGRGPDDLAAALAAHPRFAAAWAQKLCYYADSAPCAEDDPEFERVVDVFRRSGHDFKALVRELFSSPLVTGAAHAATFDGRDVVVSIARANHLCDALALRLGLGDFCELAVSTAPAPPAGAPTFARAIPADAYGRGSEVPVTLSDTSLFFQGAVEGLCAAAAERAVDAGEGARYRSGAPPDEAVADLVRTVMALAASDPRSAPAAAVLRGHYDAARAAGAGPAAALKSTFVLACASPPSVAVGL
jgi:hypothetical protein